MAPVCRRVARPDRDGAYPARPVAAVAARAAAPPVGAAAPEGREAAAPWSPRFRAESELARGVYGGRGGQPMLTRICPGHRMITRARRASRALETVKKVLTAPLGMYCAAPLDACHLGFADA